MSRPFPVDQIEAALPDLNASELKAVFTVAAKAHRNRTAKVRLTLDQLKDKTGMCHQSACYGLRGAIEKNVLGRDDDGLLSLKR